MVLGKLITFAVGFYVGVYADQNYKLPKVDDWEELKERVNKMMEAYKK